MFYYKILKISNQKQTEELPRKQAKSFYLEIQKPVVYLYSHYNKFLKRLAERGYAYKVVVLFSFCYAHSVADPVVEAKAFKKL